MRALAVGDVHAKWKFLNQLINKKQPDIILQCGDFGYWPLQSGTYELNPRRYENGLWKTYGPPWRLDGIKNRDTKIYWCKGNHDDLWELAKVQNNEILPNVFYQKNGSTITLPDGRIVLFMGGAESMSRPMHKLGIDWFPEELITEKDFDNLPDTRVDIVISHTCPQEFLPWLTYSYKSHDPSVKALSYILERYRPTQWVFGHWHQYSTGFVNGCSWTCLDYAGFGKSHWWEWLK